MWAPNAALWLIWSINYYGQGTGNGYAIDNLSVSASVAPITAPSVSVVSYSGGASGSGPAPALPNPPRRKPAVHRLGQHERGVAFRPMAKPRSSSRSHDGQL